MHLQRHAFLFPRDGPPDVAADPRDLRLAHPAGLAAEPIRRVDTDERDVAIVPSRLGLGRDPPAVGGMGAQPPRADVVERDIVIARHGEDRRRNRLDERARGPEMRPSRALHEIPRDHDHVWPRGLDRLQQCGDDAAIFAAEMQIGYQDKTRHRGSPASAGTTTVMASGTLQTRKGLSMTSRSPSWATVWRGYAVSTTISRPVISR